MRSSVKYGSLIVGICLIVVCLFEIDKMSKDFRNKRAGSASKKRAKLRKQGQRRRRKAPLVILEHSYSSMLRSLYNRASAVHGKPIHIVEIRGQVDNSTIILPKTIELRLKKGSSEDNIAHELMHAILHAEGFPTMFAVGVLPLANKLRDIASADIDHIIINDRLLELGYDARRGFLSTVEDYGNVLKLRVSGNANQQAILIFGMLHELIKWHYYIGNSEAETDILAQFPQVANYWQELSSAINDLSKRPAPEEMWIVATKYVSLGDTICEDLDASIRISDLIGFKPVPFFRKRLAESARSVFRETAQKLNEQSVLVRTFLIEPKVLLAAHVVPVKTDYSRDIREASVAKFAEKRNIKYLLIGE